MREQAVVLVKNARCPLPTTLRKVVGTQMVKLMRRHTAHSQVPIANCSGNCFFKASPTLREKITQKLDKLEGLQSPENSQTIQILRLDIGAPEGSKISCI